MTDPPKPRGKNLVGRCYARSTGTALAARPLSPRSNRSFLEFSSAFQWGYHTWIDLEDHPFSKWLVSGVITPLSYKWDNPIEWGLTNWRSMGWSSKFGILKIVVRKSTMSVLKRLLELPAANQSQIGHTSSRIIGRWPCCVLSFRQHRNPCSSESAPAFCLAWQRFPRWWKVWPNFVHNIFPNNILTSFPRKGRGKSTQLRQVSKTTSQVAHGTSEMSKQRCVSGSPYPAYLCHSDIPGISEQTVHHWDWRKRALYVSCQKVSDCKWWANGVGLCQIVATELLACPQQAR